MLVVFELVLLVLVVLLLRFGTHDWNLKQNKRNLMKTKEKKVDNKGKKKFWFKTYDYAIN